MSTGADDELDLLGVEQVVVVVAHPDDETLAMGGLLADLPSDVAVEVVVASDGQASHPRSPTHGSGDLARLRREEVRRAVEILCPRARLHLLGLDDGGLSQQVDQVVAAVVPLVAGEATLILSTYDGDGHPDHEAVAAAAAAAPGAPTRGWCRPRSGRG